MLRIGWLFIIVFVAIASAVLMRFEYWRIDNAQQEELSAKAFDLEQVFKQYTSLPAILSNDTRLAAALNSKDTNLHIAASDVLHHSVDAANVASAFLMDRSGLTLASSNYADEVSFVGSNYGFRPYFLDAMGGGASTYFAVGATTGIPGYFVSEPVLENGDILGVVAVKLESQTLPASWFEGDSIAIVTDEFGVSILSTTDAMLYHPTPVTGDAQKRQITNERRYRLSDSGYFDIPNPLRWRLHTSDKQTDFRASTKILSVEPWRLTLLTPYSTIYGRVLRDLMILLGIALFIALLWKIFQQQVQQSNARAQLAELLKKQVAEKTKELQNAQKALIAESNFAMLGRMSAAINHEINQPLASLRLNLASLRHLVVRDKLEHRARSSNETSHGEDTIESTVVDLDRTAKRITRVVDTLRALPGQQKARFEALELKGVLSSTVSVLRQERKVMSQCVEDNFSALDSTDVKVSGQSILLQQALLNLLYNAIDAVANSNKPWVSISAIEHNGMAVIKVCDNGAGVDPSIENTMFEPFETSPTSATGMGLGLTLAHQIIEDHGGTMSYSRESLAIEKPLETTVFTISIPTLVNQSDN